MNENKTYIIEDSLPFPQVLILHPDGQQFVCSAQTLYQNSSVFKEMLKADPNMTELKLPHTFSYDSKALDSFLKLCHVPNVNPPHWDARKVIMIAHYFDDQKTTKRCFK